jgi:hypothetical protein
LNFELRTSNFDLYICSMHRFHLGVLLFLVVACSAQTKKTPYTVRTILPNDENIRITGRVKNEKDSVALFWSGTSIMFRFSGEEVSVQLKDERGENYFNVVIDGDSLRYIRPGPIRKFYTLAKGLSSGPHTVELIKRNEWDKGQTWFYGVQVKNAELIPLPLPNKRVIEFFGNSITAGYAIDDNTGGDSPDSIYTNNYYTYAAITARHFKADYYCTARSGIGIMISWFPLIMPEVYSRLDPADSLSRWDFRQVTPDVVVINLFQNDSWLITMPDHPSFKQRFGSKAPGEQQIVRAYHDFVKTIRSTYPTAHIICALGSMDATRKGSPWQRYVERAVKELNDKKIDTLFFPYIQKPGHPRRDDNARMADTLIAFIEKNIVW